MLYSAPIEDATIGLLIQYPRAFEEVATLLDEDMFYQSSRRLIFHAIRHLSDRNVEISLASVADCCFQLGYLSDAKTGVDALLITELASTTESITSLRYNIHRLIVLWQTRRMNNLARELETLSDDPSKDISETYRLAVSRLEDIVRRVAPNEPVNIADLPFNLALGTCTDGATGFSELDDKLCGGLQPGEVMIIGARPGVGKTALALSLMVNMATRNPEQGVPAIPTLLFSLEMTKRQIQERVYSNIGSIPLHHVRRRKAGNTPLDQKYPMEMNHIYDTLRRTPIYIDDTADLNIADLRRIARRYVENHGVRAIFIDYLQLLTVTLDQRNPTVNQQLTAISHGLHAMAKELNVPVFALAQLNREVERRGTNANPLLSDLRDSGSIEQDADVVVFLRKAEDLTPGADANLPLTGRCLELAKNRSGESGCKLPIRFVGQYTRFEDVARAESHPRMEQSALIFN